MVGDHGGSSISSSGAILVLLPCFSLMALFLVWFNHKTSLPAAVNFSGPCCVKYLSKNFPSRHVTMYEYTSIHCPQPGVM